MFEFCIESKTTFSYIVTVINDGSTDHTGEVIEQYYQKYTALMDVIKQDNKGFSGARNAGMKTLKGKYIIFLDSDDVLTDGAVNALLSAAMGAGKRFDVIQGSWFTGTNLRGNMINKVWNMPQNFQGFLGGEDLSI